MSELVTACVNGEPAERVCDDVADVVIVLARLGRALGIDVIGYIKWRYDSIAATIEQDATSSAVWLTEAALSVVLGDSFEARAHVLRLARDLRILSDRVSVDLPAAIDARMAHHRASAGVRALETPTKPCSGCGTPLAILSPHQAVAYLLGSGWSEILPGSPQYRDGVLIWRCFDQWIPAANEMVELQVPLLTEARDYPRCFLELAANLHRIEGRPIPEVLADMARGTTTTTTETAR